MKISTSLASAWAQTFLSEIVAGSTANPKIEIYSGTMPATVSGTPGGTLLAELELTQTAGSESDGTITFDPIADDDEANGSGEASWGRILNRDGDAVGLFSVSNTSGNGELQLSTTTFVEGLPVSISSASIQVGD
ncbi:hypothetical protein ACJO2E_08510 [Marinobacter sp. M1N3S26]|uniref:hypothetical protein n=1 Tax=Marinobacter sp. M1N3S26 TaxID=3382299 RepID=UPI00387B5730